MDIVRLRLRKPRRVLSFLCEGIHLQRDETCIVESDQGLEWGACMLPPEPCSEEMAARMSMRVVRKTTDADLDAFHIIEEEETKAMAVCQKRIEERGLPMHLVDVEYTFDRHKITFYFTAENRVDFRDLVRDLARELHSRIELRHIQVRDRAKLVGGLGCCGRVLCCNSWLDTFVPISMRMAKCQNLSLNPGKISGQCGRLLCCLNYENEGYERGEVKQARVVAVAADEPVDEEHLVHIADDPEGKRGPKPIVVEAPDTPRKSEATSRKGGGGTPKQTKKRGGGAKKRRKKKGGKGHGNG